MIGKNWTYSMISDDSTRKMTVKLAPDVILGLQMLTISDGIDRNEVISRLVRKELKRRNL
jgi:hypothetical protein